MRDEYEILLLEIRQGLKEADKKLKNLPCINLFKYRGLRNLRVLVQAELDSYSSGSQKNVELIKLLGG